ncbi:MAG: hypothetical protein ACPGVU_13350, partial [Limisphaerales bacterium]
SSMFVLGQTPLETARAHVETNPVYHDELPEFAAFMDPIETQLKKGRDSQTKTMSFVHGIRRHAAKLLSPAQSEQLNRLLDSRATEIKRLHDERNVLRGFFFAKAWELPLGTPTKRRQVMSDLQSWLLVWMDITMHERIAHHRLCRDAFNVLSPEQRQKLVAGEWDEYVRKSTGHKRAYFGDRIVKRALGDPSDPVRFEVNSDHLAAEQAMIQTNLLNMEARWRQLSSQVPSVSDQMMVAEWYRTSDALGSFFLNQVTNIHVLCRAGYKLSDPVVREKIAQQSERELALVSEKVRTDLVAGAKLHTALLIARERDEAAKNPPLPADLIEACREFRQQPPSNRIAQLQRLLPLASQGGGRLVVAPLKPGLTVDRFVKLLGRSDWVRDFGAEMLGHTYSCGTNTAGRQVEIIVVDTQKGGMVMHTQNSMLSTVEQVKYPDQIVPRMKPYLDQIVEFAKSDRSRVGRVDLGDGWPPVSIDNFVELDQSAKEPIIFVPLRSGRGGNAVGYLYHPGLPQGQTGQVSLPTGAVAVSQSFADGWHWAGRNRE